MAGQVVYKRTNIEGVLTLNYTDGDRSLRYIIDVETYFLIKDIKFTWNDHRNSVVTSDTKRIPLARLIIYGTAPFGYTRFIRFKDNNKFNLCRTNLEIVEKNKYFVHADNPSETFLYIHVSNKMDTESKVIIDTKFTSIISTYSWHINTEGYVQSRVKNTQKVLLLHQLVVSLNEEKVENLNIDHIDRNRLNNTYKNLRQVKQYINTRNSTLKRAEGSILGVRRYTGSWIAHAPNPNKPGKTQYKHFKISKYGEEQAKQLAIAQRKQWEDELGITTVVVNLPAW